MLQANNVQYLVNYCEKQIEKPIFIMSLQSVVAQRFSCNGGLCIWQDLLSCYLLNQHHTLGTLCLTQVEIVQKSFST